MNHLFRASLLGAALAGAMAATPAVAALSTTAINGTTVTAETLAQSLLGAGSGITINSATYTGDNLASGLFTGGTGIIGFNSGIVLTSGHASFVTGPNNSGSFSVNNTAGGDADLNAIVAPRVTNDASVLEIEFTPDGNKITFSYVFGSEEYNEFVNSSFNDVFAFFVNGVNAALIPGTNVPVTINNVNCGNPFDAASLNPNCQYYINNSGAGSAGLDTQLDGLTKVLFIAADVNPGVVNKLKIAIADTSDSALDSAVFIQGGTLTVCGGPGQPPCTGGGGGGGGGGEVSEPAGLALLGLVGLAAGWTRRRARNA